MELGDLAGPGTQVTSFRWTGFWQSRMEMLIYIAQLPYYRKIWLGLM